MGTPGSGSTTVNTPGVQVYIDSLPDRETSGCNTLLQHKRSVTIGNALSISAVGVEGVIISDGHC